MTWSPGPTNHMEGRIAEQCPCLHSALNPASCKANPKPIINRGLRKPMTTARWKSKCSYLETMIEQSFVY